MRIALRSRTGNIVIAVLGVAYAVSAIALLVFYVMDTWGAAGLIDRVLQLALIGAAFAGLLFVAVAAQNLGYSLSGRRRVPQHHRAGAAASP